MHACIHTYIHTYIHVTHTKHRNTHTYIYIYNYVYLYIYTHTYIYLYTVTFIYIYTYIYLFIYTRMHIIIRNIIWWKVRGYNTSLNTYSLFVTRYNFQPRRNSNHHNNNDDEEDDDDDSPCPSVGFHGRVARGLLGGFGSMMKAMVGRATPVPKAVAGAWQRLRKINKAKNNGPSTHLPSGKLT